MGVYFVFCTAGTNGNPAAVAAAEEAAAESGSDTSKSDESDSDESDDNDAAAVNAALDVSTRSFLSFIRASHLHHVLGLLPWYTRLCVRTAQACHGRRHTMYNAVQAEPC